MEKVVFLDLDDTLFQSRGKCLIADDLYAAALLRDGSAHSFMTPKQQAIWDLLRSSMRVIPATARDMDAYRRVALPFRDWAILDFGGIVLDKAGVPDEAWLEHMRATMRRSRDGLSELLEEALALVSGRSLAVRVRIIEDFGIPFYLVGKYRDGRAADSDILQRNLVEPWLARCANTYRLHRNGNNLAVLPAALGKEYAVRHLIERLCAEHGDVLTLGMGDSSSDEAFMAECDYALTPRGSQLFNRTLAVSVAVGTG